MIRHPPLLVTYPQHPACWSEHSPVQAQPEQHHGQGHGEGVQQMVELSIVRPAIKVLPGNVRRKPDILAP